MTARGRSSGVFSVAHVKTKIMIATPAYGEVFYIYSITSAGSRPISRANWRRRANRRSPSSAAWRP